MLSASLLYIKATLPAILQVAFLDRRLAQPSEEVMTHMAYIFEPPMHAMLAGVCFLIAVAAAWRGGYGLFKGLHEADRPSGALWLVRGIRGVIVAVAMMALGSGVLLSSKGLLVFGAIFLGEELYETGVVLLTLRLSQKGWWEQTAH
jgi:hypothetical protein